jgi:hypothetical protein
VGRVTDRVLELEKLLQSTAQDAKLKVRHFVNMTSRMAALVKPDVTEEMMRRELNLMRMAAHTAAYQRDRLVRNCQLFLDRVCLLLSSDWQCWRRGLLLKGYASQERGWDLSGQDTSMISMGRMEKCDDLLGFYSRLNAILQVFPVHERFQTGEYDHERDPVTKFTLHHLNMCDPQPYPWLNRGLDDILPSMGYVGMGRRSIQNGWIMTSRWTILRQGRKIAYIEADATSGRDRDIRECTILEFNAMFRQESGWCKDW